MRHLHEVIYLSVLLNDSRTHHGSIYRRVSTYLDIIFNDDITYLRQFLVNAVCIGFKAEAVSTDNDTCMQDTIFTNFAVIVHFDAGIEDGVITYLDVIAQVAVRIDLHTLTELHVFADISESTDIGILRNLHAFSNKTWLLNTLFGRVKCFRYELQQLTHCSACVFDQNDGTTSRYRLVIVS